MGQDKLIQQLTECALTCDMCYAAFLNEEDVSMMERCIELDRECADVCHLTASILTRDSENKESYLQLCAEICAACGDECGKHDNDHCRKCSKMCLECAEACRKFLEG